MSIHTIGTKRCPNCNRNETLSGAGFCRNCGALLPGWGQPRRTERVFDLLAKQIPLSEIAMYSLPTATRSAPMDSAWARQLAPDPVPPHEPQRYLTASGRFEALLTWGLFLLGPIGLAALFIGGLTAIALGHANYLLMATLFLVIGRLALYGIRRLRH